MSFEESFAAVKELVQNFKEGEARYLKADYSEADARNDFINKFFIALGWDVRHERQRNPYEQEVHIETAVRDAKSQRRADYSFYIAPDFKDVKFFVEAKKPCKDLYNDEYYFQTCRYGWNAQTPIAFLTDFEELHILDCRYKPDIKFIKQAKYKQYHYLDYLDEQNFREIYHLLSRDAVAQGAIEKFAEMLPKPKGKAVQKGLFKGGYQPIDEAFLEELDDIRNDLARSFKKNNPNLESDELTEAALRTIDRLVFIRFLEDKMIEPDYIIDKLGARKTAWKDFIAESRRLDAKYNGIVFKPHIIDKPELAEPDDKVFGGICEELSHINSPYNFDILPIHILGSIYERFLGKVVHATAKQVKIEEKPEVRKAGGVYYTPQYIVNYIVDNTIGRLIEGKTPKEIESLRFADIACGSGSFLITVFEKLLDYHKKYYQANPDKAEKDKCVKREGAWALSLEQKKKILLNNIYGVDIDPQAVEVTQLSLYLKLFEDETTASTNDNYEMFKEALLPSLKDNIICGNSLVGTDIYENDLFEKDEERKLRPIDFSMVFPDVMKRGGFDAIVGNPPYGAELTSSLRKYLSTRFKTSNTDTAELFLHNSKRLIKKNGYLSYIIPKALTYASNWKNIRDALLPELALLVDCSKVWKEVKLEMSILMIQKESALESFISYTRRENEIIEIGNINKSLCQQFEFIINGISESEVEIGKRIYLQPKRLNDYVINQRGGMFQSEVNSKGRLYVWGGKEIGRYTININNEKRIDKNKIADKKAYLNDNSVLVQNIVAHIMNPTDHIKIIATDPTLNEIDAVILDTINQLTAQGDISIRFILSILNSKLLSWYVYRFIFAKAIRTMHFDNAVTERIPYPDISQIDKSIIQKSENLVKSLSASIINLKSAKTDSDIDYYKRKCYQLDGQIDALVYELYGLTPEEIEIVEKG